MTEEDVVVASESDGPVTIELDGIAYDVQMVASRSRRRTTASTT